MKDIHERALRFAYKDYQIDFESLLEQRNLVSIHVKNLQLLTTEIHKTRIKSSFREGYFQGAEYWLQS